MSTLHARDLMVTEMVKVPPETPVSAIARMFANQNVSTAAVTDASGKLLGIVTETDLIRRLADGDKQPRSGWLARLFQDERAQADRYVRSHGATAGEIMSSEVVTAAPDDTAFHLARLMEEHRIRRVLVTDQGRLVGLVSRLDLVRALATPSSASADELSDEGIRKAVVDAMQRQAWTDTTFTAVNVREGVVEFHGFRRSVMESQALRVLAENVPGVRSVIDNTRPLPGSFAS